MQTSGPLFRAIADLDRVLAMRGSASTGLPVFVAQAQVLSTQIGSLLHCRNQQTLHCFPAPAISFGGRQWASTLETDSAITRHRMDLRHFHSQVANRTDNSRWDELTQFCRQIDDGSNGRLVSPRFTTSCMTRRCMMMTSRGCGRSTWRSMRQCGTRMRWMRSGSPGSGSTKRRSRPRPLPSWREIELGHGFHETRHGVRFTISPQARADVLDKLLALNHYRYQQEVKQGLHSRKGRGSVQEEGSRAA